MTNDKYKYNSLNTPTLLFFKGRKSEILTLCIRVSFPAILKTRHTRREIVKFDIQLH